MMPMSATMNKVTVALKAEKERPLKNLRIVDFRAMGGFFVSGTAVGRIRCPV
jgi:hypothetical protein